MSRMLSVNCDLTILEDEELDHLPADKILEKSDKVSSYISYLKSMEEEFSQYYSHLVSYAFTRLDREMAERDSDSVL